MNPLKSPMGDCSRGVFQSRFRLNQGPRPLHSIARVTTPPPTRANEGCKNKAKHPVRGRRALCLTQFRGNRRPTAIKGGGLRRPRLCGGGLGIGGLGRLAIQFAYRMGFGTMVIGRGKDNGDTVIRLGLHYIGSNVQNAVEETSQIWRSRMGGGGTGAKVILVTVPGGKAMNSVLVEYGC